jgi:hypothetical protein
MKQKKRAAAATLFSVYLLKYYPGTNGFCIQFVHRFQSVTIAKLRVTREIEKEGPPRKVIYP